jgi:hypothetical protein
MSEVSGKGLVSRPSITRGTGDLVLSAAVPTRANPIDVQWLALCSTPSPHRTTDHATKVRVPPTDTPESAPATALSGPGTGLLTACRDGREHAAARTRRTQQTVTFAACSSARHEGHSPYRGPVGRSADWVVRLCNGLSSRRLDEEPSPRRRPRTDFGRARPSGRSGYYCPACPLVIGHPKCPASPRSRPGRDRGDRKWLWRRFLRAAHLRRSPAPHR